MAPIWVVSFAILLVLVFLLFGVPILTEMSFNLREALRYGVGETSPEMVSICLLAMLLIFITGIVKMNRK